MKILIVFTTITEGSSETYDGTWQCIERTNGRRESSVTVGQKVIGKIYVFNGNEYSRKEDSRNKIWNYESIVMEVDDIFSTHKNDQFLVLFHGDMSEMKTLYESIKNDLPQVNMSKLRMTEYSSSDRANRIWTDHVSGFCSKPGEINDKFIALWNDLWGTDTLKTLQNLRYEILSPLVAHDLIEQAIALNRVKSEDVSPGLRKQIDEAVEKLNDPISQFCSSMASINCEGFRKKLEELRNQCRASSGDQSWETFHKDLKEVAEKMETQIQAIGG